VQRKIGLMSMQQHVEHECPESVIQCSFHRFGCKEKLKRKDELEHIEKAAFTHTHLVKMAKKIGDLQDDVQSLKSRVAALENNNKRESS